MVYNRALNWLIPGCCPGCGDTGASGFCAECRAELPAVERVCRGCGLSRPVAACPRAAGGWCVDAVVAPFAYAEPLQGYLHALKFAGRRHLGPALGELLADHLRASDAGAAVDVLIAVPLHRRRLASRGYNQAIEIARPVAVALDKPLLRSRIGRRRATVPQTELGAKHRRLNPRGAFVVSRALSGLRVAIVDDVITTGATINVLALECLRAGAWSVQAWAIARSM